MKYKLKKHVTDDMLVECGFDVVRDFSSYALRKIDGEYIGLYVALNDMSCFTFGVRYIEFDNCIRDDDDITPYIQDLIALEYVEILK